MAYELRTGDTYPPLTIKLEESCLATDPLRYRPTDPVTGALDTTRWVKRVVLHGLTPTPQFRVILKLDTPLTTVVIANANIDNVAAADGVGTLGTVTGEEPGNGVGANVGLIRAKWQTGNTDQAGTYEGETEVTWNTGTTPPQVETFPNDDANNFVVIISPDLD